MTAENRSTMLTPAHCRGLPWLRRAPQLERPGTLLVDHADRKWFVEVHGKKLDSFVHDAIFFGYAVLLDGSEDSPMAALVYERDHYRSRVLHLAYSDETDTLALQPAPPKTTKGQHGKAKTA